MLKVAVIIRSIFSIQSEIHMKPFTMNAKQFTVTISVCVVFLIKPSDLAAISRNSSDEETISTECQLSNDKEALCVSIYDCVSLLYTLDRSSLLKRVCGQLKDRTNPFVCCEKHLIKRNTTLDERPRPSDDLKSCGIQEITTRIVGGQNSSKGEFPWLARLLSRDQRGDVTFHCTGSLISSTVVLTTAHCLVPRKGLSEVYAVALGEHETECSKDDSCLLNKTNVMVSRFIIHEQYEVGSKNHDNDIGLIFLRDRVTFTEYISPICLLEENVENAFFDISGWGTTEYGATSKIKKKLSLPPYTWEQCANKYKQIGVELSERQICAGGMKGQDSCQGDSGGPLMLFKKVRNITRWYVAGLVSFGLGCGKQGWPGVYANVPSYVDWIKNTIDENYSLNINVRSG